MLPTAAITLPPEVADPVRQQLHRSRGTKPKGRSFSSVLLAALSANKLYAPAEKRPANASRPVLFALAATTSAARATIANLRCGRPLASAANGSLFEYREHIEVPKSLQFTYDLHTTGEISIVLAYYGPLFACAPTTLAEDAGTTIRFLFAPPLWWLERQAETLRPAFGDDALAAARAALFAAYLDHRTPLPIVHDLHFQLALYRAAQAQPWCCLGSGDIHHDGLDAIGLDEPMSCNVAVHDFAAFLAKQTSLHYAASPSRPLAAPIVAPPLFRAAHLNCDPATFAALTAA